MRSPVFRYDAAMIRRTWFDWSKPLLPQAAGWLLDEADAPGELGDWLVVTPGARAGRLLLRALLERSRERSIPLAPPRVITPSALAEAGLRHGRAVATGAERVLAWMHVLRAEPALSRRIMARPPEMADHAGWHEIASMLAALHAELGGEQVPFERVAEACGALALDAEADRWHTLAVLRTRVVDHLGQCGLADPDEAASTFLAERGWRLSPDADTPKRLILLGIVELSRVQRRIVEAFADRAAALVHAPPDLADRFDELGCVRPQSWADATIDLPPESIILCDRPRDQAQAAIRLLSVLASHANGLRPDQVVIGLGDESLGETIARAAEEVTAIRGQPAAGSRQPAADGRHPLFIHLAPGMALERTGPWRLLEGLQRWLAEPRFAHLAALVRHPDLEQWLGVECSGGGGQSSGRDDRHPLPNLLSLLDDYFTRHLHDRLESDWLGDEATTAALNGVRTAIASLAAPLDGPPAALGAWAEGIVAILNRVYAGFELDGTTRDAGERIRDVCRSLRAIPPALQAQVSGAHALQLVLTIASRQPVPSPVRTDQIDAVGWLELHLDPAEHVVVTGLNDGRVPGVISADPFLPDGLRSRLGLTDNLARLARDTYLLDAMRRSRTSFTIILGRHDGQGEPLLPSRLLLAVPPDALPERVLRLTDGSKVRSWPSPLGSPVAGAGSRFTVPQAPAGPLEVPRMKVTQFKAYLACPYRFWLGEILGLKDSGDRADELDPMQFGSLLHGVLRLMGEDDSLRDATRPELIARRLRDALRQQARALYGDDPMPAVRVQLARLAQRLDAFARAQAAHRRAGWRIKQVEFPLPETAMLDVPGEDSIRVSARIDRVDQRDGEWLLIDYKSSESGETPQRAHGPRRDGRWLDLQLPLYEHLYRGFVNENATPDATRLAYFVLPRKAEDAGLLVAEWTPEERAAAVDEARRIVKAVRAGEFPMSRIQPTPDPFASICHATAFAPIWGDQRGDEGDDEETGEGGAS